MTVHFVYDKLSCHIRMVLSELIAARSFVLQRQSSRTVSLAAGDTQHPFNSSIV